MEAQTRETLQKLRDECADIQTDDPQVKQVLDDIMGDIDRVIETPDEEDHHHSLRKRLTEAVAHFEAQYPGLTTTINTAARILSTGGV